MTKEKKTKEEEYDIFGNPYEQPMSAELLLRSHTMTKKIIDSIKQKNDSNLGDIEIVDRWGMSTISGYAKKKVKAGDVFCQYESRVEMDKLHAISQCQNQRSGKWYTLDNLIKNGVIAESERELFKLPENIQDFPYRQIYQMHRRQLADKSEWFTTAEQWVGLTDRAAVLSIPVSDIHSYIKPHISVELRNADGTILQQGYNISNQPTSQVSIITTTTANEVNGTTEFLTEFNESVVRSAIPFIRGNIGDSYSGCSMTLIKEGASSRTTVKTLDDFLAPFDTIWSRNMESKPAQRVDTEQLLNDLKRFGSVGEKDPNIMNQYK
jgi:hypothetical protein